MELKKLERCQKFAKKFLTLPFRSYWSLICDSRCLVNQTFFSFVSSAKAGALQLGCASLGGLCSTEGSRGGGLGGCVVVWGVGARGWRHPPNPGHATKRLLRCPKAHQQIHRPISQFVITSRLAFDAFKENGLQRRQLRPTCAAKVDIPLMLTRCISLRIHFNFYTLIINQSHPIFSWLLTRPNWARKVREIILFIGGPVDWVGAPVDRWDMGNMSTSTMSMSRWHCINMVWHGITWYDMV